LIQKKSALWVFPPADEAKNRPDFAAPIYPYVGPFKETKVPADAPPMFIAVASNDDFGFAPSNAELYTKWLLAKKTAELHIYSKGGHGFGMKKQNLPSDNWIELFYAFLKQEIIKQK
jgi:acetyl esterase/lipase